MTTATISKQTPVTNLGATVPFDEICDAGAYVCNWSGHLLRVADPVQLNGRTAAINIVGNAPLTVTKISDNPMLPLSVAKQQAARLAVHATF